jgi:hypothetical protein
MRRLKPLPTNRSLIVWRKNYIRQKLNGKVLSKKVRTICEVLRELYKDARSRSDPVAMTRIEEAHDMAKRMQRKLQEYSGKGNDPVYLILNEDHTEWLTKEAFKAREKG